MGTLSISHVAITSDSLDNRNLFEQTPLWHHGTMSMTQTYLKKYHCRLGYEVTIHLRGQKLEPNPSPKTFCSQASLVATPSLVLLWRRTSSGYIINSLSQLLPLLPIDSPMSRWLCLVCCFFGSSSYQAIQNKNFTGLTSKGFPESLSVCCPRLSTNDYIEETYNNTTVWINSSATM